MRKRRKQKKWKYYGKIYGYRYSSKPYPVLIPPSPLFFKEVFGMKMWKILAKIDTVNLREKIIEDLEELRRTAHKYATDSSVSPKLREKYMKLETYIAQTLNSILNDYDIAEIKKKLKELRRIAEEMGI